MADEQRKKIIEGFDEEIQGLNAKLNNMASLLGDKMAEKLKVLANNAGDFVEAFEKGEDIAKSLDKKLKSVRDETDKLGMKKLKLENDLARVQRDGLKGAEDKIRKALLENKLATKQLEDTSSTLTKLKQVVDEEEKITEEKKKQNDYLGKSLEKVKGMVKPFTDIFTVAGVIDAIVEGVNNFDKASVNVSKNIGYTKGQANDVARTFQEISLTSESTSVTLKSAAEASNQLADATGGVVDYSRMSLAQSKDILGTQVMLTRQLGLSGEEAAGIYKFSILTGKSSEKVNDEMLQAFANTRNVTKGSANFKATMAEAAKVSGQLAANLQNNPALITKAIVQAQALGTTLEQTKEQGASLLDFESSIENELKAELLTGKQMNLERARAAALTGDQVTLAQELNKNVGTLEDFQKMNVIQQEAVAKAVGLTADKLAEQLKKQKIAKEQGKSLAEINAQELKEAEKRQTIEDRFADTVGKVKDIIGSLGALFAPVIQSIAWLVDNTWVLYTVLGVMLLAKLPAIVGGFKSMASNVMEMGKGIKENVSKLFSKEGRKSLLGGGDKTKEATETAEKTSTTAGKGGGGNAEGFKERMKNIAEGIKAFGNKEVLFGALNLIPSSIGLIAMIPGVLGAKLIETLIKGEKFQENM
jgi:hypothetical protein